MTVNWNRQNFGDQNPEKHPAVEVLRRDMPEAVLEVAGSCGEVWAVVSADNVLEVLRLLKDNEELAYDHLSDLTAVHWPRRRGAEFDLVYQLYSIRNRSRFRVKVPLTEGQEAKTACGLWMGADWLEREVFDMFGINFAGHPDQRRILNPDGFDGYPLRKDFPLRGRVRW